MSYTKTTWQTGDTVTAEKLNNIENGIEDIYTDDNPIFVVIEDADTSTLSKTYAEIVSALTAHKVCIIFVTYIEEEGPAYFSLFINGAFFSVDNNKFCVETYNPSSNETLSFVAETENDYPTLD